MTDQPDVLRVGDWLVDVVTGEIVGHAKAPGAWQPESDDDIEFVLSLILEAEANLVAIDRQKQVILQNLAVKANAEQRRIDWLTRQFGAALEQLARGRLDAGKKRSLRFAHGVLKLRTKPARRVVEDEYQALVWAREYAPDAVKTTTTVLVSQLPDGDIPGVRVEPASETFSIETGGSRS